MFEIKTKSGVYKVRMREYLSHIKSEKALRELVQRIIDDRKSKPGWEGYAKALQVKLDSDDLLDITKLLGYLNYSKRVS